MTTARAILEDCLTFGLNRLSPGETADPDTLVTCLRALNHVVDEHNGAKGLLIRELLTASTTISAASAALGTAWASLAPGDEILGATYSDGTQDIPLERLTMAQYHELADKTQGGDPRYFAHDGLATVYMYPVPTSRVVTLRTKAAVTEFADLDTDYSMPKGFKAGWSAMTAEVLAPTMNPGALAACARKASAARSRLAAQTIEPGIISGRRRRDSILEG